MKNISICFLLLIACCVACDRVSENASNDESLELSPDQRFDKLKWSVKEGLDYPFRAQMLNDIVYNDTIRTLMEEEILEMLGEPDRSSKGHLYYQVTHTRLGLWPLKTKTLVIKISTDRTIDWIKIHG